MKAFFQRLEAAHLEGRSVALGVAATRLAPVVHLVVLGSITIAHATVAHVDIPIGVPRAARLGGGAGIAFRLFVEQPRSSVG